MADSLTDAKSLQSLKVVKLKEWLQRRGIKTSGNKKADLTFNPQRPVHWPLYEMHRKRKGQYTGRNYTQPNKLP